jgi:hypothetical protein
MTLSEGAIVSVTDAKYLEGYKLCIRFSDGEQRIVDFEPFLTRARNPHIRAYLQLDRFRGYVVENGDLVWGDYDLCFPIADLYEGRIR